MKMTNIRALGLAALCAVSIQAQADELDPVAAAPGGLVVRVDAEGKRDVFKVTLKDGVISNDKAAAEVVNGLKPESKIKNVQPYSELDDVTSNESWHWFWKGVNAISSYYAYTYRYNNSYYNYYPSYSYYGGGYNYQYYYTPTYYGSYAYSCYQPRGLDCTPETGEHFLT